MGIWKLIFREIFYRKGNFALALVSVSTALVCFIGTLTLLRIDRDRTTAILTEKQAAVQATGAALEDAMRKITKGLGFNVVILPHDQDLNEMHLDGTLSKSMPEEYVDRLAASDIVTINHLLPTVMKKLTWPEMNLPVIVYGTRGEVPIQHRDPKKPLLDAVPRGQMIMGFEVAEKLGLSEHEQVTLLKSEFEIIKIHPQRGTIDDGTVWINLRQAQELFGMQNLIHAIQALECHCAGDRITAIRREIAGILPGTQVIERGAPALARAEARNTAKQNAEAALADETQSRLALTRQREAFARVLIPVVLLSCALWMGFLAMGNVRDRWAEIGVLRALGYESQDIIHLFLGKFLVVAIVGTLVGYPLGLIVGGTLGTGNPTLDSIARYSSVMYIGAAFLLAGFLSSVGSTIPALMATRQDPATILRRDT